MINKFFLQLLRRRCRDWQEIAIVIFATFIITLALLGIRQAGGLQPLELIAYDRMVQLRPNLEPDPRLLLVAITEEDIRAFNRWPVADETLAQVLQELSELEPQVMGLDVYRDIRYEPGHQELLQVLKSSNVIVIKTLGDAETKSIPPPKGIPEEQVGFNDLLLDPDNVVRRNLMFADSSDGKGTSYSFSLRLALHYLLAQNIQPKNSEVDPEQIEWGQALFKPLLANSGGYQGIDAQGYQILLDYRSGENAIRQVSLSKLLYGQVPKIWVKDKIVLIGTVAPSAKDLFLTPYSPAKKNTPKTPGVVVHAQMVSQILDAVLGKRALFIFWPQWAEVLWIASWATIGATLAWSSRHPLVITLGSPLLIGVLFILSYYLFINYRWVPVVTPGLALIITGSTVIAYRAFQAQQQQQIVMRLLGQNTSPEVANALWNSRDRLLEDGKLPGVRLTATILFTDIKNFSTISEQIPPEKLMEWLNEYLAMLAQSVQHHHGIINKFTGDGILAAFGVPMPRQTPEEVAQDAQAAVSCALEMRERLQRLNESWQKRNLPVISMRVGIFTGPIVAGSLGGKERLEYGLLGDSVNIASRLESCLKDRQSSICRILIAQETFQYLTDDFEVENWGLVPLKGRQEMVCIYQVISKRGDRRQETEDRR